MKQFQQRSSWPSSLLTGFIGWIGWLFIGPLLFSIRADFNTQLVLAVVSAPIQIVLLRTCFRFLQMHRSLWIGAFWGALSAILLYGAASQQFSELGKNQWYWLLIYIYVGAPVGGFLSYFYMDDQKIHVEQGEAQANYGRDAHWLEPFGFGVLAYLIAFHPVGSLQLIVNVIITGAISGVAAAGVSHFSPDQWKRSYLLLVLIIMLVGCAQGAITGWLFRDYHPDLIGNYYLQGITGGILTYGITFLRGRQLAYKEQSGLL